ncbi:hypothetical protein CYMTET_18709, partial [Cymbomonas tetramitiformis]
MASYALTDKNLANLPFKAKKNRYGGPHPIKLYLVSDLMELATNIHGSVEAAQAAAEAKLCKSQKRKSESMSSLVRDKVQTLLAQPTPTTSSTIGGIHLMPFLTERTRVLYPTKANDGLRETGDFVLYWMQTALRCHENPALAVARAASEQLKKPLLVACYVLTDHPWANDRRVTFMLEGLANAAQELRVSCPLPEARLAVCVAKSARDVAEVARRATLVITEDMPVEPHRR